MKAMGSWACRSTGPVNVLRNLASGNTGNTGNTKKRWEHQQGSVPFGSPRFHRLWIESLTREQEVHFKDLTRSRIPEYPENQPGGQGVSFASVVRTPPPQAFFLP